MNGYPHPDCSHQGSALIQGEYHAPGNSIDARSQSLQRGRTNRSAAKYLALCPLISARAGAKFSSPGCLIAAIAVQQRGLASGAHGSNSEASPWLKRVRPPQLRAALCFPEVPMLPSGQTGRRAIALTPHIGHVKYICDQPGPEGRAFRLSGLDLQVP